MLPLGSTILLTNSAQVKAATYLYDSWGNTTLQTGTQAAINPWRYAGGYKDDATGYTKFGARYYGPGHGRFTQPDPSGQEANRYLYAGANPTNNSDPSGLFFACGNVICPDPTYNTPNFGPVDPAVANHPGNTFGCRLNVLTLFLGPLGFPAARKAATEGWRLTGGALVGASTAGGLLRLSGF